MFSIIKGRRSGKTFQLLQEASVEKKAIFVVHNRQMVQCVKDMAEYAGLDIDNVTIMSYAEFVTTKINQTPVFIDELPLILKKHFGNVQGFSGTCEIYPETEPLMSEEDRQTIKGYLAKEEFNAEYELKYEPKYNKRAKKIKELQSECEELITKLPEYLGTLKC